MPRHWTINGRFLTQPVTGVQRYAREIVAALDLLVAEEHPLTSGLQVEILAPGGTTPPDLNAIGFRQVGNIGGHVWEQTVLPTRINGSGLISLCNTGPLSKSRHIVCMHDANMWNAPESYSMSFRALYRTLLPALGRTALKVATVSAFSKQELVRHRIAPGDRIFLAPNGHEHVLSALPRHSSSTRAVASLDTIVLIGSPAPHKNTTFILSMADLLRDAGLRIAVVGKGDPRVYASLGARAEASNISWLGRISDEELAALLQDSLCLAFPSLTEGFGLPALEAMAIGCPVVTSDRASLPEVCANAALYADPGNTAAWMEHFMSLKQSKLLRRSMLIRGRARASAFSWRISAMRFLEVMADIDDATVASPPGQRQLEPIS